MDGMKPLTPEDVRYSIEELRELATSAEHSLFARFLAEELIARDWDTRELARRMGDAPVDELVVGMILAINDRSLLMDEKTAYKLATAFGVSERFLLGVFQDSRDAAPTRRGGASA